MKASYHRETYLTDDLLKDLGFYEANNFLGHKSWRIKFPYYSHIMQITIRPDLHRTNPNCGIFSLIMVDGNMPDVALTIAYHVDTAERLHSLINILTYTNLY